MHFDREKHTRVKWKLYKVLRNHNHLPSKTMIMQESSAVSGKMRPKVLVWNQQTKLGLPRALFDVTHTSHNKGHNRDLSMWSQWI